MNRYYYNSNILNKYKIKRIMDLKNLVKKSVQTPMKMKKSQMSLTHLKVTRAVLHFTMIHHYNQIQINLTKKD